MPAEFWLTMSALAIAAGLALAAYAVRRLIDGDEETTRDATVLLPLVRHTGATEDWSPTQELALVPVRSLDPFEAAREDEAAQLCRAFDRIEDHFRYQLARIGQRETDTTEWTREEIVVLLAGAR